MDVTPNKKTNWEQQFRVRPLSLTTPLFVERHFFSSSPVLPLKQEYSFNNSLFLKLSFVFP